jgi:hypothetical protein
MVDGFLAAHWTAPRVYDISGRLSPVSIRDQMIRARMFADRAIDENLVSNKADDGLVVIGGGAAGMTAAMRAVERGIPTLVLERAPHLFPLQRACTTRWIDPTQYDWPMSHWGSGNFPIFGLPMQLPWSAARADQVAWNWVTAFQQFASSPAATRLTLELSATPGAISSVAAPSGITIPYQVGSASKSIVAGALLVAAGFGTENTQVGQFRSSAFWEDDRLEQPNLGLPGSLLPEVLISGGGDGALQDFLRVMTGQRSAKDVLIASGLSGPITTAFKDFERLATHALRWGMGPADDHEWHKWLDDRCKFEARTILQDPKVVSRLGALLSAAPKKVCLMFGCEHLTPVYFLNRFVAHLINEYRLQVQLPAVFSAQTRLLAVHPHARGSACNPSRPQDCYGRAHQVVSAPLVDCRQGTAGASTTTSNWNVILVRHGLARGAQLILGTTPLVHTRQILPYFLL